MRYIKLLLPCVLTLSPLLVQAQEHGDHAARAETLRGVVEHVNYANGTIDLQDASGHTHIIVTSPSTTITGSRAGYEEFSDIRRGAHLTVEASNVDSQLDAALIKIHDAR